MSDQPKAEQSASGRLTEAIISDGGPLIAHMDAEGGAWFALNLLEILDLKAEDGWQFIAPLPGNGVELIAAERRRQIEQEDWTPEHDDEHSMGELRQAARAYAGDPGHASNPPAGWPWDEEWWKPSEDAVRNLVKAGALIAAEIDRLQRGKSRT